MNPGGSAFAVPASNEIAGPDNSLSRREAPADRMGSSAMIANHTRSVAVCEIQARSKRVRTAHIDMCDEASLRQPAKPKPRLKLEQAGIRKKNSWPIRRVELGQDPLHQPPHESTVAVLAMSCYGSNLVAVVRLPIDHVPHGLAAPC
jgi:hypothetical protein